MVGFVWWICFLILDCLLVCRMVCILLLIFSLIRIGSIVIFRRFKGWLFMLRYVRVIIVLSVVGSRVSRMSGSCLWNVRMRSVSMLMIEIDLRVWRLVCIDCLSLLLRMVEEMGVIDGFVNFWVSCRLLFGELVCVFIRILVWFFLRKICWCS